MNGIEVLKDLAGRAADVAGSLRETPAERLNAHPGHDNSIAWLLWHAAREIDVQVAQLSGEQTGVDARGLGGETRSRSR